MKSGREPGECPRHWDASVRNAELRHPSDQSWALLHSRFERGSALARMETGSSSRKLSAAEEPLLATEGRACGVLDLEIEPAVARLQAADRIWLVGTGTSQHAAELGGQMLRRVGADARWESAAGFARPPSAPDPADALILITHTGETAFARSVRRQAVAAKRPLVSITGIGVGWGEAIEVAPRERSETYTATGSPDRTASRQKRTCELRPNADSISRRWRSR